MRLLRVLPLLLVLAGCASGPARNTPEAECRRQAYDDPAVKSIVIAGFYQWYDANGDFEYRKAYGSAYDACLRQKGLSVPGGVEPVREFR